MHFGRWFCTEATVLHCKDVKRQFLLVPASMLSLLVSVITQFQFCCSCPDVLLVSAVHLYRRGHGFVSR